MKKINIPLLSFVAITMLIAGHVAGKVGEVECDGFHWKVIDVFLVILILFFFFLTGWFASEKHNEN